MPAAQSPSGQATFERKGNLVLRADGHSEKGRLWRSTRELHPDRFGSPCKRSARNSQDTKMSTAPGEADCVKLSYFNAYGELGEKAARGDRLVQASST